MYLNELVFAFNFLHGVLFMIAELPCSREGKQEQEQGQGQGQGQWHSGEAAPRDTGSSTRVWVVSMVALSISVCGIWMINVFT